MPLALLLLADDVGILSMFDVEHAKLAVRSLGSVAVFAFALVEVIPLFSFISPGITALVIAGSIAPDSVTALFFSLAAFSASVIGNTILYSIGHFAGPSLEKALRLPDGARMKAEEFIRRRGALAVILGQFFSILRPTVAFASGVLKMHPARFFPSVIVGAALWAGSSVTAGFLLKEHAVILASSFAAIGVVTMVVFAVIGMVQWVRTRRRTVRS